MVDKVSTSLRGRCRTSTAAALHASPALPDGKESCSPSNGSCLGTQTRHAVSLRCWLAFDSHARSERPRASVRVRCSLQAREPDFGDLQSSPQIYSGDGKHWGMLGTPSAKYLAVSFKKSATGLGVAQSRVVTINCAKGLAACDLLARARTPTEERGAHAARATTSQRARTQAWVYVLSLLHI